MSYLQIIGLVVIGIVAGYAIASVFKTPLESMLQDYNFSLTAVDGGGWMCTIGTPRRVVGKISPTPLEAVQSAIAEIEGAA